MKRLLAFVCLMLCIRCLMFLLKVEKDVRCQEGYKCICNAGFFALIFTFKANVIEISEYSFKKATW